MMAKDLSTADFPDIDRLVAIASRQPDVFGARLTGGGFGGAVVILCGQSSVRQTTERILLDYRSATHRDAHAILPVLPGHIF
jgi:galactokinase